MADLHKLKSSEMFHRIHWNAALYTQNILGVNQIRHQHKSGRHERGRYAVREVGYKLCGHAGAPS